MFDNEKKGINENEIVGPHKYRNNETSIPISNKSWQQAEDSGLIHLVVNFKENETMIVEKNGHEFINLCSCSYLGLSSHPAILQGAIDAINEEKTLHLSMSTLRMRLTLKERVEAELSRLFNVQALQALSASVAIAGTLPLIASGHLAGGKPHVMIFDRFCHFSMAYMKPACADEALTMTCPHDDLNFIEDICKKYPRVAYVTDGVYSMGGLPSIKGLLELQDKYGLFLFFDDSHSISIKGSRGEGYILSQLGEINERTVLVGSLGKGFGANGAAVMLGHNVNADIIRRHGGPMTWSQDMNVPGLGAVMASIKIHQSPELGKFQEQLLENIELFDSMIDTPQKGNKCPIRLIVLGEDDDAILGAKELFEAGFYSSAVYFPIVPKGGAGLRIMLRSNIAREDIIRFCNCLKEIVQKIKNEKVR
ncbi:MAG TPA: aminotransferase class I/II-fold pyridoxal phosphate-dependent enzyme [Candidatus Deferrimicrobium sp.]|nr:aminotransferase class I/II-fold pyridoxal phosphate-dependent enzyme [Candidatus Deferrimicrobium sp.]